MCSVLLHDSRLISWLAQWLSLSQENCFIDVDEEVIQSCSFENSECYKVGTKVKHKKDIRKVISVLTTQHVEL